MSMRSPTIAGLFCAALVITPAAAGCNFFEALFGGCTETMASPQASGGRDFRRPHRVQHTRHREPTPASVERAGRPEIGQKQIALKPQEGEKAGSLAIFERDATLRPGDIVATIDGFLEYRGGGTFKAMEPKRKGLDLRLASVE